MTELDPLHYINVGPHGTFRTNGQWQTTPAQIDALFDHLDQHAVDKILLYFHGGLVSEAAGMAAAERLTPTFSQIHFKATPSGEVVVIGPDDKDCMRGPARSG